MRRAAPLPTCRAITLGARLHFEREEKRLAVWGCVVVADVCSVGFMIYVGPTARTAAADTRFTNGCGRRRLCIGARHIMARCGPEQLGCWTDGLGRVVLAVIVAVLPFSLSLPDYVIVTRLHHR